MRTHFSLAALAVSGLLLLAGASASASPPDGDALLQSDADLPTNRPIVATVVEVDEDAGRVTLDTPHGQVALEVSQELAERLSPGDVVVLRLTDDDADFPSASPREAPETPSTPAKSGTPTKI